MRKYQIYFKLGRETWTVTEEATDRPAAMRQLKRIHPNAKILSCCRKKGLEKK